MNKELVVDGRGHIAGRLAANVTKKLLEGWKITITNVESIILVGPMKKHEDKYKSFLRKRNIVNPRKGHKHHCEPSMHFYRIVRGMLHYKRYKGRAALENLTLYECVPEGLELVDKVKFPHALFEFKAIPGSKFVTLGELLSLYGWKRAKIVDEFTAKADDKLKAFREEQRELKEEAEKYKLTRDFSAELQKRLAAIAN